MTKKRESRWISSDLYLLALAVANGVKFATFGTRIPADAVAGGPEALEVIPV